MKGLDFDHLKELLVEKCWANYNKKIEPVINQALMVERYAALNLIDKAWAHHIDAMNSLKSGISLRSYAQSNPLQAYVNEGYMLFDEMMNSISYDMVTFCMNLQVKQEDD